MGRTYRQQRSPGLLDLKLEGERYLDDSWNVVNHSRAEPIIDDSLFTTCKELVSVCTDR